MEDLTIKLIEKIDNSTKYLYDNSLFNGICASLLTNYEVYSLYHDRSHEEKSYLLIDQLLNSINDSKTLYFSNGLAGILYTLAYLSNEKFIITNNKLYNQFDPYFDNFIRSQIKLKNYDILCGIIGIGIYYLELNKLTNCKRFQIKKILETLISISVEDERGLYWCFNLESYSLINSKIINLGYLHGIPSIISFFLLCYKEGHNINNLDVYINKALSFLIRIMSNDDTFSYPNYLNSSTSITLDNSARTSRLAYCYGDMPIAHLFFEASYILNETKYFNIAIQISSKLFPRLLNKDNTSNAFFCHGLSSEIYFVNSFRYVNPLYNNKILLENLNNDLLFNHILNDDNPNHINGLLDGYNGVLLSLLSTFKHNSIERILVLR